MNRADLTSSVTGSKHLNPSSPTVLFGFDVLEYLGRGAASDIYAVSNPATGQIYALKHVVHQHEKSKRFFDQLEAEFRIGSSVVHPNLRRSIDLKVNRTLLRKPTEAALTMELFDGQSLEARPPSSIASALDIFIQTGKALGALHAAGFVHCDLKPDNILRSDSGVVKVIDLGQACPIDTVKERVQGTPDYMAPEQVKLEPCTVRTDVFNFGATLYWALTGKNIPTLFRLKKSSNSFLVDTEMPSPRSLNPLVPETLSNLVLECVRSVPHKRPSDMTELVRRLEIIQHVLNRHNAGAQTLQAEQIADETSASLRSRRNEAGAAPVAIAATTHRAAAVAMRNSSGMLAAG